MDRFICIANPENKKTIASDNSVFSNEGPSQRFEVFIFRRIWTDAL